MKLEKKKDFAAKTLGVGKARVVFNNTRLADIKEAITRQDIRDLVAQGAISVIAGNGRLQHEPRKRRRGFGSVRKRPVDKKRQYILITRKLRSYIAHLKTQGKMSQEQFEQVRKKIRARTFKSLAQMKEHLAMGDKK
jgi:large subunit ribosomal protein L19e